MDRKKGGKARRNTKPAGADDRGLVDMREAIRILRTTRPTFYRWLRSGRIKGMKVGRQWRFYREDIERFLRGEEPRVDLPVDIAPLVAELRRRVREAGWVECPLEGLDATQQAVRWSILLALALRASSLHITTHQAVGRAEPTAVLRFRVDGVLQEVTTFDRRLLPAFIVAWKRLTACDVHETKAAQNGRVRLQVADLASGQPDKPVHLLTNFLPATLGESVTAHILDTSSVLLDLERIDYAPADRRRLLRALDAAWGAVFVTGPTGCGKTTLHYCCLNHLAGPEIKIMTVEDPVEYLMPWATQVAVNEAAGMTFSKVVREMLRSDPDVIVIGEIRDLDSLRIALQAALTGHLVLSTLHTDEACSALTRMVDLGMDPFLVADAVRLVLAQRLVRRLCTACRTPERPAAAWLDRASDAARLGGIPLHSLPQGFQRPVGCPECGRTGFRGRNVIAETLEMTPELKRALKGGVTVEELRTLAVGQGMTTMAADGVRRAAQGETPIEEVLRVVGY